MKNKAVKIFMVLIVAVVAIFGTVAIVNSSKNGWEPSVKETKEPKTKKAASVAVQKTAVMIFHTHTKILPPQWKKLIWLP